MYIFGSFLNQYCKYGCFRSPTTHKMSKLVRRVFLEFLPRILMMKRPERIPIFNGYFVEEYCVEEIFDASKYSD
jgi:nicotinic acetylcholine receptor